MFSLLTLHFYCFYIYSLRLYQVWIYGLGEFLNLFRGLKYNPLKVCYPTNINVKTNEYIQKRVDSVFEQFDTQRFILGAMIFSIFIFLFPTVLIFYLIFTMARFVCHFVQDCLHVFQQDQKISGIFGKIFSQNQLCKLSKEFLVLHSYLIDSIARRLLSADECPETNPTFQKDENLSLLNKIIYGHNF